MTVISGHIRNVKRRYRSMKDKPTGHIPMASLRLKTQKLTDHQNRKDFGITSSPCVKTQQVYHH